MEGSESNQGGLTLRFLGSDEVIYNDSPLSGLASDKVRALLTYLAVESDRAHRRSALAEMFWPNRQQGVGRKNLKQALANLRKVLGDRERPNPFLLVSRDQIQFDLSCSVQLDVREYLDAVEAGIDLDHADCAARLAHLQRAVDLYRGDFLEDFSLDDCQEFEEWVVVRREALRRKTAKALRHLIELYAEGRDLEQALSSARKLVRLEPWSEANHRRLMRLLIAGGRRSEALRQFQACKRILAEEFDIDPSEETAGLYKQIRAGTWKGDSSLPKPARRTGRETRPLSVLTRARDGAQALPGWFQIVLVLLLLGLGGLGISRITGMPTAVNNANATQADERGEGARSEAGDVSPLGLKSEREILVQLYLSTDGERWKENAGWLSDEPHCSWYGISCTAGAVTSIDLQNNYLYGPLPEEISHLVNLHNLSLNGNHLSGEIPPELGALRELEGITLGYNDMEGTIPAELGHLSNLRWLGLSGNAKLGGEIPPELGNLALLESLELSSDEGGTQLSGTIPPELGNLTRLNHLVLANAMLQGPIPVDLGNLTRLKVLDLSNNPLSGTLPPELGNLSNLTIFAVGEGPNGLAGPLPTNFMGMQKLQLLQYHQTEICEPSLPEFQAWLASISELYGTGIRCAGVEG
jgi:DNA-binding SARP family transcriptional activator